MVSQTNEIGNFDCDKRDSSWLALKNGYERIINTVLIGGISQLAHSYDTFLIDQWGVLHNGYSPYPGVLDCLQNLVGLGKKVIIISNSGKRAEENIERLSSFGIQRNYYSDLVTSGEITWQMLAKQDGELHHFKGMRCFFLGSKAFLNRLKLKVVSSVQDADFILLTEIDDNQSVRFYESLIEIGTQRGIPLICSNPDHTRITTKGLMPSAGAVANRYQTNGGKVVRLGKPNPEIYNYCLRSVKNNSGSRNLAIGDSIHHDVGGGSMAGLDTLLIMEGIHGKDFGSLIGRNAQLKVICKLAKNRYEIPTWAIPSLRW